MGISSRRNTENHAFSKCIVRLDFAVQEILSETTLKIPVIDGRAADWTDAVSHLVDLGKNFFVILRNNAADFEKLVACVGYFPNAQKRAEILIRQSVLEPKDLDKLIKARKIRDCVFCVEMIKVPQHQPPRLKPFIAYCELRGIIGHADTADEARELCGQNADEIRAKDEYPQSSVYGWRSDQWVRLAASC